MLTHSQTASGAVACQLLDALHPGAVALHKVCISVWAKTPLHASFYVFWMPATSTGLYVVLTPSSMLSLLSCSLLPASVALSAFVAACHIIRPTMQVDFNASKEYEYITNYKVLQAAFTKIGIDKVTRPRPHNQTWQVAQLCRPYICVMIPLHELSKPGSRSGCEYRS